MGCSSSEIVKTKSIKEGNQEFTKKEYDYYIYLRNVTDIIFNTLKEHGKSVEDKRDSDTNPFSRNIKNGIFLSCSMKCGIPTVIWCPWGRWEFIEIKDNSSDESKKIMAELQLKLTLELCKNHKSVYRVVNDMKFSEYDESAKARSVWRAMQKEYKKNSPSSTASTINSRRNSAREGERKSSKHSFSEDNSLNVPEVEEPKEPMKKRTRYQEPQDKKLPKAASEKLPVKNNPLGSPLITGKIKFGEMKEIISI